ncbi:MAG: hypothetical protein KBT82_08595 [Marinobacter sp.]|uniref:hypothetical protein n=1 Tax=Marinobacter sp. TaxID=50741 RepID=UPI001B6B3455|nr:hypothetical protein [Marinobacter sp.]MBQ0746657.1 hypothetical protein [Marinobacter sp.]MBQ0814220.1 hypothetical protein [Marinobacter sp.]
MELELPEREQPCLEGAIKYNSARAAFASLLDQLAIKCVWLPRYLCDSMAAVLKRRDVTVKLYDLAMDFTIASDMTLEEGSMLLYVNYFGVCGIQAQEVISRYGKSHVVIDNSQAFFCGPFDCVATIYSPRKFFGLPDGGLLYSDNPNIRLPETRDGTSETRMGHLISRLINSPEKAYQQYIRAEQAIAKLPFEGMSRLTERLLRSVDFQAARAARTSNARYLHDQLGEHNKLSIERDGSTAPLCYPFLPSVKTTNRTELIQNRVFLPSYWPEVLTRVEEHSFESELVRDALFLPCDQRYSENDMMRIVNLLNAS